MRFFCLHMHSPELCETLYAEFGPQHWWPGETPFEIIVGAVLTQNTAWSNVENAIANLKRARLLTPTKLARAPLSKIRAAIKPSGYYNQKALRIKKIAQYLAKNYGDDLTRFLSQPVCSLRHEVESWKGVGPETRDSILLYAAQKPVFVIDAYTVRVAGRMGMTDKRAYRELQAFFESSLPKNPCLFNEFHALLVHLGKNYCRKTKPLCASCPVKTRCRRRIRR